MRGSPRRRPAPGFTLLELMVVMVIVAIATGIVTVALRDSADSQLEKEAVRLSALLDSARAQARISGAPASWSPAPPAETGFRFAGLPEQALRALPQGFLDADTQAVVVGASAVVLGPEPLLPAQRVLLKLREREITIGTDGISPFAILATATTSADGTPAP